MSGTGGLVYFFLTILCPVSRHINLIDPYKFLVGRMEIAAQVCGFMVFVMVFSWVSIVLEHELAHPGLHSCSIEPKNTEMDLIYGHNLGQI